MSQLLAGGFLTEIFLLILLSLVTSWTDVALIIINQKEAMVTKGYWNILGSFQKRKYILSENIYIEIMFDVRNLKR